MNRREMLKALAAVPLAAVMPVAGANGTGPLSVAHATIEPTLMIPAGSRVWFIKNTSDAAVMVSFGDRRVSLQAGKKVWVEAGMIDTDVTCDRPVCIELVGMEA